MKVIKTIGIAGAGTMGSALAQKFSQEGFNVILIDKEKRFIENGLNRIVQTVNEGVERKIFTPEQSKKILDNIRTTTELADMSVCDLIIEAIFEDIEAKKELFRDLDKVISNDTVLATNTSSYSVTELAESVSHPENFVGLHYFYHAAKNRLVEIIPGEKTSPEVLNSMKRFAAMSGKDAIICNDSYGFVVNRFFVPWLNEAVRLHEEGIAEKWEIDKVCEKVFSIGMGPFALMNATGVPVAYHAQKTLEYYGDLYKTSGLLKKQAESATPWVIENKEEPVDKVKSDLISSRMLGIVFLVCGQILDEKICSAVELNRGARIGLRWRRGPVDLLNKYGEKKVSEFISLYTGKFGLAFPSSLKSGPLKMEYVKLEKKDTTAIITISRPEDMNALNENIMMQLSQKFDEAESDESIRDIIITGEGKAFVAGADIKFFIDNIRTDSLDSIVTFTKFGQDVYSKIEKSRKSVTGIINGLALGGGLELALCCDNILALPNAMLAFPETGIGIYPGLGGTQRTRARIGKGLTKYLIFTGDFLNAEQAENIGLIDGVITLYDFFEITEGIKKPGNYRNKNIALNAKYIALQRLFNEYSVREIMNCKCSENIISKELFEKIVKKIKSKAPLAIDTAEVLINEAKGCASELNKLTYIFSTSDALLGLSSIGKKVEFQKK